ncbi:hypothetical protein AB0N05_35805 [Nocardia sp. NPDC051030]
MALSIKPPEANRLARALAAIRHRCATLPVIDNRSADEIISYDEQGLPV